MWDKNRDLDETFYGTVQSKQLPSHYRLLAVPNQFEPCLMWPTARLSNTTNLAATGRTSFSTIPPAQLDTNSSTSPSSEDDTPTTVTLDNLVETTVTSSGINSMWHDWKNPHAVINLCTKSENESALEMRRQKNRESMRRSRQRQRDQLQLLRDAVIDLEQQYKSIRLRSEPLENDQNVNSTSDRK